MRAIWAEPSASTKSPSLEGSLVLEQQGNSCFCTCRGHTNVPLEEPRSAIFPESSRMDFFPSNASRCPLRGLLPFHPRKLPAAGTD